MLRGVMYATPLRVCFLYGELWGCSRRGLTMGIIPYSLLSERVSPPYLSMVYLAVTDPEPIPPISFRQLLSAQWGHSGAHL